MFDCFDGTLIEYFAGATGITAEPPEGDGKSIGEIIEEIWRNEDRAYNIKRLVRRLRRIDKTMTGEARDLFARFIAGGDVGAFAEDLPKLLAKSFSPTMQTLRDQDFQRLLDDYPRGQRTFIVAPTVTDTVGSEWLIRGADGKQYKPDDYITVFVDFVRDNSAAIDALAILLSRPRDWNPDALLALRDALKGAPQHFTEQNLERAFRARYHKALVDIISMVKHAAADTAPLLTAAERVDAAIAKVVEGRELTRCSSPPGLIGSVCT